MGSPECEFGRVWLIAGAAVSTSVSAFAGQLRKIEATCHVSKSVWFD